MSQPLLNQSLKPKLWVIVDDNSTDNTPQIIKNLENNYTFIQSLSLKKGGTYDSVERYGYVIRKGFEYLEKYSRQKGLNIQFYAILDADIILDKHYYEKIIETFLKLPKLGLASGKYIAKSNIGFQVVRNAAGNISFCGATMIFRKKCFRDIGGFPIFPTPDTVAIIKAINLGWGIKVVQTTYGIHLRPYISKRGGIWRANMRRGRAHYKLNYHPFNAVLDGFLLILKTRSLSIIGYLYGYFKALLSGERKIDDEEIKEYFWKSFHRRLKGKRGLGWLEEWIKQ